MPNWIKTVAAGDIEEEDVVRFDLGNRTFALYRSPENRYYATDGFCTHERTHPANA